MKYSVSFILFSFFLLIWYSSNIQWGKDHWKNILEADAKGYYAYLPAVFIYNDMHFNFHDSIEKKYYDSTTFYEYRTASNGYIINKYYSGTALMQLPFFVLGHITTKIAGTDADGYSKWYQVFINIGSVFYLCMGMYFLSKLLHLYSINDKTTAVVLFLICFGTNLFYYSTSEPGLSHVYSFFLLTASFYFIKNYFAHNNSSMLYMYAIVVGLAILVRPVNIIAVAAIPFFASSLNNLLLLKKKLNTLFPAVLSAIAIASIQLLIYKIQCGSFFVYSYGEEGFNFLSPEFLHFLFSYKKGFFVYTPIAFFALTGLIFIYRNNKQEFYSLLFFFLFLWYILSSWWNWWYGGSFGSRVMVDYYALTGLLLGILLKNLQNKIAVVLTGIVLFFCVGLNQFQNRQYRYLIIHWENMNKEKYWDVFLKAQPLSIFKKK